MYKEFIVKVCIVILITMPLHSDTVKYISTGLGIYSAKSAESGFDFLPIEFGYKINNHKVYLGMPHLIFIPKNEDDSLSLLNYSINYDYSYYKNNNYSFYIGVGLSLIKLDYTDSTIDKEYSYTKLGSNLKTGFLYSINESFNINCGLKYLYVNHNLIKDTLGYFTNIEYNF